MKRKSFILKIILVILLLGTKAINSQVFAQKDYPIQPIPFNHVSIEDQFWAPRLETNRQVSIPHAFKECEETGRIDNFAIAAGLKEGNFVGLRFNDADVYKVIEGACYSLKQHYDPQLDAYLDSIIQLISGAQEDDGYLYTSRTIDPQNPPIKTGEQRWSEIIRSHELLTAGNIYEAAVAHFLATNKKTFLDVAIKNADLICNIFGPGKINMVSGHPEIEIGLIRLYKVTGSQKYLNMAKFFIDERGNIKGHKLFGEKRLDHVPVIEQTKAVGHAVMAPYLYCGMADLTAITKDTTYIYALDRIWSNMVGTKIFLTGGVGAKGELFGEDYELPNDSSCNETCAAIGSAMWNYRMFMLHGESKYIDILERVLYNGLISGVSLDGDKFFYFNPLNTNGENKFNQGSCKREPWFECACCPTNIVRFLPTVSGYIYAKRENDLYVNLFIGSTASFKIDENEIKLKQETNYPWNGKIKLTISSGTDQEFRLFVRIPGWANGEVLPSDLYSFGDNKSIGPVKIRVNNEKVHYDNQNGYFIINRKWENNDQIIVDIPMETRRIVANEKVKELRGYEAYQRGPVVYCFEGIDNNGNTLNALVTDKNKSDYSYMPQFINSIGIGVIHFKGQQVWKDEVKQTETIKNTKLIAIPYFAWANRGEGSMTVWLPQK